MRFLLESAEAGALEAARAAHDHGLDGVLLTGAAPLVAAAVVAAAVDGILIAAEAGLGDRHPLELAEEAAVVDVASAGRLVLVVRPATSVPGRFAEALDLLRVAFAARPFRHAGEHWTVPARLPQNVHNAPATARLMPAPFQPRLELWTAGAPHGSEPHLGEEDDPPATWDAVALGGPRARREPWRGSEALVARLREGRAAFGQDWAVVRAPAAAARAIGAEVRPRVQLDELPPGLEELWSS